MSTTIRKALPADWDDVLALVRKFPEVLVQEHLPEPEEFFVAEESGRILGCCALEVYSKRMAEIRTLAVAREHQGTGIGKALIEACLREAEDQGILEVLAVTSALPLFEKYGFSTFKGEKYALLKTLR